MKLLLKVVGAFAMGVALLLAVFTYNIFFNRAKPEITLIPEGYVGPVIIWFGGISSVLPQYENGIRVYAVPSSGILREQAPVPSLWESGVRLEEDDRFFYVKADGSRVRLPVVMKWSKSFIAEMSADELNRVSVYGITTGRTGSKTEYFVSFVVGRLKDGESLIQQRDKVIENP